MGLVRYITWAILSEIARDYAHHNNFSLLNKIFLFAGTTLASRFIARCITLLFNVY